MDELRLGFPAFGACGRIEQPIFKLDLRRLGPGRIDAEFCPEFLDGPPVARQPSAVLVGTIAFCLPPRAGREEAGVVRHVELSGITDPPPIRPVIAQEYGIGVDLLQNLQIALRLDFKNGPAPGTEPFDLRLGIRRRQFLGALRVVQISPHERRADGFRGAALLHDDRVELVTSVNREDLVAVLDTEQPFPTAALEKQPSQRARPVVGVQPGGNDESKPAAASQQRVCGFQPPWLRRPHPGRPGVWTWRLVLTIGAPVEPRVDVKVATHRRVETWLYRKCRLECGPPCGPPRQ